jgi:hypothetical protein
VNREQRRHPERLDPDKHPRRDPPTAPESELRATRRVPDDPDVRAKSTGHGKKTADKWNQ